MYSPASLFDTSIRKTCDFLKIGVWNGCEDNPLSCLPTSITQRLLFNMWSEVPKVRRVSVDHSRLLLTSGKLWHFEMPTAEDKETKVKLLQMLSRGCQNLRTLSLVPKNKTRREWVDRNTDDEQRALQELLANCSKLEHLHSSMYFDPYFLKNSINLKILRLHFSTAEAVRFSYSIALNVLKRLKVYALCQQYGLKELDDLRREIVWILGECPQLTSLGSMDFLAILKKFATSRLENLAYFRGLKLSRCYWGPLEDVSLSDYCDLVRMAADSCPLMKVLIISVGCAEILQYLKTFRNLTFLDINFGSCTNDYEQEFYSLLEEIGPQLRYLSVVDVNPKKPLNLNIICRNCPKLTTLRLICSATADEGAHPCANLINLKRLSVRLDLVENDTKGIFFLLSSCLNLEVLFLDDCQQLDDGKMRAILYTNPFSKLGVAFIRKSSLSELALASFIQRAVNLSVCCLGSDLLGDDNVMRCVRGLNPGVVCISPNFYGRLHKQFFPNKLFSCSL